MFDPNPESDVLSACNARMIDVRKIVKNDLSNKDFQVNGEKARARFELSPTGNLWERPEQCFIGHLNLQQGTRGEWSQAGCLGRRRKS